jgi:hypothetical protein
MPGSAIITAFLPITTTCTTNAAQTHNYTFNAEVPVGVGCDDHWHSVAALCSLYVLTSMEPPADDNLCLASVKIASINPAAVDNVHGMMEVYDMELDAFLVGSCSFFSKNNATTLSASSYWGIQLH